MPIYRFADLNVAVTDLSDRAAAFLQDYRSDAAHADFEIVITADDLKHEQTLSAAPLYILEVTAVLRQLCDILLYHRDGLFLHAATIVYENKAYAFTAPAGTGKTTHCLLWKTVLGDKAHILNGDKLLLRRQGGRFIAYGNPWKGKEGLGTIGQYELGGIFVLARGNQDRVQPLSTAAALPALLGATVCPRDISGKTLLFDFLESLLGTVPAHILHCSMNDTAVHTALSVIENGGTS